MRFFPVLLVVACTQEPDVAEPQEVAIDASSFRCIQEMEPVRGFYVDNLLGNLDATLEAAQSPDQTPLPPGTVVQLVPQEAMVKREAGFSPETGDWEFFFLNVSADGTEIATRGTADTTNVFGGNCLDCHAPAAGYDYLCEQDNGCAPLPIGEAQFEALQEGDPRCP